MTILFNKIDLSKNMKNLNIMRKIKRLDKQV